MVSDKPLPLTRMPNLLQPRLANRTSLPGLDPLPLESQHLDRAVLEVEEGLDNLLVLLGAALARRHRVVRLASLRLPVLVSDKQASDSPLRPRRPLGSHRNLHRHLANPLSRLPHLASPLSHLPHLVNLPSRLQHLANPPSRLLASANLPSGLLALEQMLPRILLLPHPHQVVWVRHLPLSDNLHIPPQHLGNLRNPPRRSGNRHNHLQRLDNRHNPRLHLVNHPNQLLPSVRPQHRRTRVSVNLLRLLDSLHSRIQHLNRRVLRLSARLRARLPDSVNLHSQRLARLDSAPDRVRHRRLASPARPSTRSAPRPPLISRRMRRWKRRHQLLHGQFPERIHLVCPPPRPQHSQLPRQHNPL